MKKQKGNLLIVLLIGVAIAALIYFIASPGSESITQLPINSSDVSGSDTTLASDNGQGAVSSSDFPRGEEIIRAEQFSVGGINYILELVASVDGDGVRKVYQRMVSHVGGVRSIVVPDIDAVVPSLGKYALTKFAFNEQQKLVVFAAKVSDGSLPMGDLYKFDITTGRFTKMFVSRFLPTNLDAETSPLVFSPDKTKFLSINDRTQNIMETRNLYLINLANDQARVISIAPTDRSFTQNLSASGEPTGSFRWIDDLNIEYLLFPVGADMPRSATDVKNYFVNPAEK